MLTFPEATTLNNSFAEAFKLFSSRDVLQVEARRLAQAQPTQPGLTDLDRCPVQKLGTASLPNLNRMRHQGFLNFVLFVTENRQFHKFIILTMMLPFTHDSA